MNRDDVNPTVPGARVRLAQILAFVGLLAALVGALGPAERLRTSYSWPPETLPTERPESLWYTPLLLIKQRPEALTASIPCTLPPPLPGAREPVRVLATARSPERGDGLAVTRENDRLTISIGARILERVRLPAEGRSDGECVYRLQLGAGGWALEGGPAEVARGGALERMPFVSGLFSGLDLRAGEAPAVEVLTAVHATRTITRQAVAWTIAALAIAAALLLVAVDRRPRPGATLRRAGRAVRANAHPVDAVVGAVLLGWWLISPAFFDDGWVTARERAFSTSGGFSEYYATFGASLPLDYWIEWLHHWLADGTSALALLRIPALLCLAASWALCRVVLARVLASSAGGSGVALWALAGAFLAGALAWGMTLRPEPVVALAVLGVLASMVLFLERENVAPLAAAAVLLPLALAGHPAGIVALAPVLAAAPRLLRFAGSRLPVATAIAASTVGSTMLLLFVGSDLEQRRADAQTTAEFGHSVAWRYELIRYTSLADFPWGTPLRRASVVLMVLAVLAFLLRRRGNGRSLLDFPVTALAVGLLLFVATPSKHPWHFGALLGLAAVAVASETARLRADAARSVGLHVRPFLALAAAVLAIAWTWAPRQPWNAIDLRTLDWTPSFETWLPVATLAAALPLLLLAAGWLRELARGRRERLPELPALISAWTAPMLALPLIAFTVAVLVADAAKTDGWTLTRSNLSALRGNAGCGLADDLLAADPGTARVVSGLSVSEEPPQPTWMRPPPVDGLPRFALGPVDGGSASTPWFEVGAERPGLFVLGTPVAGELELEWGRLRAREVESLGATPVSTDFALDVGAGIPAWRLVAAGELPPPGEGADRFRVTFRSGSLPGRALAVTAPVAYASDQLARRLGGETAPTLVLPNVLPYFPCTRLPRLAGGIVQVPGHVVATRDSAWVFQERETSPFSGVHDLYPLERLPVTGSGAPLRDTLAVFAVDARIPGAAQAPPDLSTIVS